MLSTDETGLAPQRLSDHLSIEQIHVSRMAHRSFLYHRIDKILVSNKNGIYARIGYSKSLLKHHFQDTILVIPITNQSM